MGNARGFGSGPLEKSIMDYGFNVARHSSDGLDLYRVDPADLPYVVRY